MLITNTKFGISDRRNRQTASFLDLSLHIYPITNYNNYYRNITLKMEFPCKDSKSFLIKIIS